MHAPRRFAVAIIAGLLVSASTAPAQAHARPRATAGQAAQPVKACASLATLNLSAVNAEIDAAEDTTTDGVGFCQATGYISPQTHFTILLPEQTWKGSDLQQAAAASAATTTSA